MCVAIILNEPGKRPTLEQLRAMERGNSDGAGVGWYDAEMGTCRWVKGLTAEGLNGILDNIPRPALVHFRFATVGGNSPELCHPFPVSGDMDDGVIGAASEILIHNGHWSDWDDYYRTFAQEVATPPKGKWSDTRFAAYLMALAPKERDAIAAEVDGKVAILSATPEATGVVTRWGDWTDHEGCLYSNMGWSYSFRGAGWKSMFDWWDPRTDNKGSTMAPYGSGQYCGTSHRYRPLDKREPTPPAYGSDDMAWEAYWAAKKQWGQDMALARKYGYDDDELFNDGYNPGDWVDEPTEPEMSATDEFRRLHDKALASLAADNAAAQALLAAETCLEGGTGGQQLREVTAVVNGVETTYYTLEPAE